MMEIPLRKVPEMFFDQQLWQIFISYFETPEIAYERIGQIPYPTGYHRESDPVFSKNYKDRWQEIEEAVKVGQELLRGLDSKFLKQELLATGIRRGLWPEIRVPIPPSEWLRLWPNFAGNFAVSTEEGYGDVQVSWCDDPNANKAELQERLELFLSKRQRDGQSRRKILINEAAEFFGGHLPDRIFAAAYKKIFNRKRGRPRLGK
jgi:hypothetical protein